MLAQGEAGKVAQDVAVVIVVIPARYGSTRYPGKPLKMIAAWSMVHRVWCLAKAAPGVTSVYVATDDDRIASHVRGFGGEAIMTPPECNDGTERVFRATEALARPPAIVVNLQGAGQHGADPTLGDRRDDWGDAE